MKKIKFERSLIDLERIIVNWSNDMERIDYILYEIKDEYREIVRELYNEEKKG
ncbi:MAG: hypothetical protein L6U99_05965 [Clostridium sp.]|nr:MAG: hypothetical protein L6U99_05965 [Clostridium sp.]